MWKGELIVDRESSRFTDALRHVCQAFGSANTPKVMDEAQQGSLIEEERDFAAEWPSLDEVYDEIKDSLTAQNDRLKPSTRK